MRQHLVRFAADHQCLHSAPPVRGHHDQVALPAFGLVDDGLEDVVAGDAGGIAGHASRSGVLRNRLQVRFGLPVGFLHIALPGFAQHGGLQAHHVIVRNDLDGGDAGLKRLGQRDGVAIGRIGQGRAVDRHEQMLEHFGLLASWRPTAGVAQAPRNSRPTSGSRPSSAPVPAMASCPATST
ncbi:hypothetical protein D3C72_1730960 [compost metagenome]